VDRLPALLLRAAQEAASQLPEPVEDVRRFLTIEGIGPVVRVAALLLLGFPLLLAVSRWLRKWASGRDSPQRGLVVSKLFFYTGVGVLVVWILDELGFGLAPLLGAAGIFGIAIGFASQTSVSNIISGFFLMAEQPFRVDDIVQVGGTGGTLGRVQSIDMLSVKLRTFDNKFVRIPNESIIKTEVTNVTRYPIRRVDVAVGVAYREDVEHVRRVLLEVADANPLCLMEPAPVVLFDGYGESSLNFSFRVWATRENWLDLKDTIHEDVKERFDEEGIEIPFPHRSLYAGSVTEPFPVRLADDDRGEEPPAEDGTGGERPGDGGGGASDEPPAEGS
jgi:small-conductance mechanosensitive channel